MALFGFKFGGDGEEMIGANGANAKYKRIVFTEQRFILVRSSAKGGGGNFVRKGRIDLHDGIHYCESSG